MSKRIQKPRTRISRNTRTEVMAPTNTRRKRTRAQQVREALQEMQDDIDEALAHN